MMLIISASLFLASAYAQTVISEKPLTNKDVVSMVSSGITAGIIKASIEKSKTAFDLSPGAMIELKKSKTPDDIVLAMISKARTAAATVPKDTLEWMSPGIYNRSEKGYRPVEPHPLLSSISKGAVGMLKRTFGTFINLPVKAAVAGSHAALIIDEARPVFLFILDFPARSPEEFFLVRLSGSPNAREISFQRNSNTASLIGINDTLRIAFTSRRIQDGAYEVSPVHPLRAGEYCFLYNASSLYKGNTYKGFDFTVMKITNSNE
jgi:hypothetical protein